MTDGKSIAGLRPRARRPWYHERPARGRATTCVLAFAVWCFLAVGPARAESLLITTFAGPDESPGAIDGTGSAARFYNPSGVAVDASGNVYVADTGNNTIRRITPAGVTSTLAGLAGSSGTANGTGSTARFSGPLGVAVDGSGNVYVADTYSDTIRKITPAGVVSTLAGLAYGSGSADGTGSAARFYHPSSVAVDGSGNAYVADSGNNTIRKISPAGVVSTLAGLAGSYGTADGTGSAARFDGPSGVAVDGSGNVYVADAYNCTIRKITPAGVVSTLAGLAHGSGSADGTGSAARFHYPTSVAADGSGNVYVADNYNDTIRKITPVSVVSTLAGLALSSGSADGTGSAARFSGPLGVAADGSGNVYVADTNNNTIRKSTPAGVVSTLAGLVGGSGSVDGTGGAARFSQPSGVAVDGSGNIYVADTNNHTIRKVTPGGMVSTLAGLAGSSGSADGTGNTARFYSPSGAAVDGTGNIYVSDQYNCTIRKITPAGVASTLAGLAGSAGNADGTGSAARFNYPAGVAVDGPGNVYVADTNNNTIRKITPAGVVSTLAGWPGTWGSADGTGGAARFANPRGVAVDGSGNVYVADEANYTIRKITPAGVVSTLAGLAGSYGSADGTGSAARFDVPSGVAVDGTGNVYVADYGNFTIRKVTPAGVVSTLAGLAGSYGSADGTGSAARFNYPAGVALDGSGEVYVADYSNNTIRIGGPSIADMATIDQASGAAGATRQLDTNPQTASSWQWSVIRVPAGSSAALTSTTIRNPAFTPTVAGLYVFRLVAADASGNQSITSVQLLVAAKIAVETAANGSGTVVPTRTVNAGSSITVYAIARDASNNFVANVGATWSLLSKTGGVVDGDLVASSDTTSARFTGHAIGTAVIDAASSGWTKTDSGMITVATGTATRIRVETAADGNGTVVPAQNVNSGNSITAYAITRDAGNNFVANVAGTWSLLSKTGGVVNGDLVASGDTKSATFTGHVIGTAVMDAASGSLTKTDSGTITVTPGLASALLVAGFPSPTIAGAAGNVIVAAQDAGGNTATGYTGTVHFASTDGQALLPADYTFVSGDNGSHSFSVVLKTAGTQSITAVDTATGTIMGTQSGIAVNPGPLAKFALALSSPQMNGLVFTAVNTLTAQDALGNTVTTFDASVDNVRITANAPLGGDVYGLGTGNNYVLNRATDFVAGVADLTALGMRFVGNYATGTFTATSVTGKSGTSGSVTVNGPGPGQPGRDMQVVAWLTIPASVSIAWGAGTTGRTAGDLRPFDWTVQDLTGSQLVRGETCLSNDANNNLAMNLENTSNTGTNARVFAAVASSGGWSLANAPATDTFAIKAQSGTNPQAVLAATSQELTGTATLAKGADQALVVTVMTPTDITRDAGVEKTMFVVLTATPE